MRFRLIVLALVSLSIASDLSAQRRRAAGASRFWFAGGGGPAWTRVSCDICRGERDPGFGAFVRVGGAASRGLLLGGELAVWTGGNDAVDQNAWSISAAAYLYPGRTRQLSIKGGVGYTSHHASDGTDIVVSSGFGPQFGIGYEVRLSPHWRLTPHLNASFGVVGGGVRFNGADVQQSAVVSVLQLGVGLMRR